MRCWLGLCVLVVCVAWTGGVAHAAPNLAVTPDSPPVVDLGSVRVNNAATTHTTTKVFTISNTGNQTLMVFDVTFTNSDYKLNPVPAFPLMITNGSPRTITVEFDPNVSGPRTVTMTINSNDPGDSAHSIDLTGTGTNAVIGVTDIDFGIVNNSTSSSQNIAVTNTASTPRGPLTVTSATISGSTLFAFGNTLGCSGGASCTFTPPLVITTGPSTVPVLCQPGVTASGVATATVTFTSDTDALGDTMSTLSCTAGRSNILVSAIALNFGNRAVGQTSKQTVTITNSGTTPLTYSLAKVPDISQFAFTAGCTLSCSIPATPGMNSATFDVTFIPTGPGALSTRIDISNNDPDPGDNVKSINVSGTGDQGVLATVPASPTALDFGGVAQGLSKTSPFTLKNSGNVTVTGITAQIGNPALGFQIVGTVPTSLAPLEQVALNVQFAPPVGNAGGSTSFTFQGSWTADGLAAASSAVLNVTGVGQTTGYDVSPTSRSFGDFQFDSRPTVTYQILNTAQADVTVLSAIDFVADPPTTAGELAFAVTKGGLPIALSPPPVLLAGEHLDVAVTAQLNRTGVVSGHVNIRTNFSPDRQVALSGNAVSAAFSAPSTVDFGAVDIDGGPQTQTFKLINTGVASLDINSIVKMPGGSAAFAVTLPTTKTTVAPGTDFSLTVTYTPTTTRPMNQFESLVLDATLAGVSSTVTHATITIQGRGIDRVLAVDDVPAFSAFRNPGDGAPVHPVTVRNDGEALLKITGVMVDDGLGATGSPVWQLVDAEPVDIPGNSSHDFLVKFVPREIDDATHATPRGHLVLVNNDSARSMATINLSGACIARNVRFGADGHTSIALGQVRVGIPIVAGDLLEIANNEGVPFTIRRIELSDGALALDGAPSDAALPASATTRFDMTLEPTKPGTVMTVARLYLDEDPEPSAEIQLTAHAVSVGVHGGGGCSTGGGGAGGAVLALAAIALSRRRRALVVAAILGALLAGVRATSADDVVVGVFDPTPATRGTGFQLETPEVGRSGAWVASGAVSYAKDLLVFDTFDDGVQVGADHAIQRRTMLTLGGAYAFLDRFEAGLKLPVYSQSGDTGDPNIAPPSGTALGDLTLHGKMQLGRIGAAILGAATHITLPTATARHFTGADAPTLRALALATWSPDGRWSLSASAGAVLRKRSVYADISQGSGFSWGAGVSYRLRSQLWVAGEVFGEVIASGRAEPGMNTVALEPVEALVGATYRIEPRWSLGLALGRGVTQGIGAPDLRGILTIAYTMGAATLEPLPRGGSARSVASQLDSDGDGIVDRLDRCPREPEDKDGFEDNDGCPDLDNDGDGIADARDRCPNEPEDKDGFQDDDGCPDPDNDRDGIADARDRCPDEPETVNGKDDDDGCPDELETAPATSDPRATIKAAEDTFNHALVLMQQARYAEACSAFEQSQRLDPQFGTQYQIAACYQKIGKLATAWNLYRELARSDANATRRPKAARIAAALAPRVPRIKLVLRNKLAGVQLMMNGVNANALIGIETPVDLGHYAFVATADGHREWRTTIDVKDEGKVVTLVIDLVP